MVNQLLLNGIIAGSIYSMIPLGFSLIYQTTRFFHFAHAAVYTFAAYFIAVFRRGPTEGFGKYTSFPFVCSGHKFLNIGNCSARRCLTAFSSRLTSWSDPSKCQTVPFFGFRVQRDS